jgi:hypothetical protein
MSAALRRALRAVAARARLQRAIDAWVALGAIALGVLSLTLLTKTGQGGARALIGWCAVLLPAIGALGWALLPISKLTLARAIDRALGTPDLVASALELGARPSAERSAFERACIAQADTALPRLRSSAAWPLVLPRGTSALCALSLLCLSLDGQRVNAPPARVPTSAARAPALLDADSARAFAAELESVQAQPLPKEAKEVAARLNALLEALARGELDRAAALAQLRALEERLESVLAEDPAAFEAALERLAQALAGAAEAGPLAQALREQPALAPKALEQLGERAPLLKKQAAERLASALERAGQARGSQRTQAAIEEAKRELERLQKQREEAGEREGAAGERDERLLKRKQRDLDQLAREGSTQEAAERQLERLQRELDAAAKALQNDQRKAAQDALRDAAREMEQASSGQRSREQAQRLSEQLAQLRAELGEQRAQGQPRPGSQSGQAPAPLSAQRFGQLARGQTGTSEGSEGDGEQAPSPGEARSGKPGEGQGEAAAEMAPLALPGSGQGASAQGPAMAGGRGDGEGPGAGEGGRPESGAATQGSGAHVDTRIDGERRAGPTRSEIIYESGQRGFASSDYAKVHDDYARHAEGVIEQQHIPGGYRFYVRRYFQLIRPRESQSKSP